MPRLPDLYYRQMGSPEGRLAPAAARWMNLGNRIINRQAVARLGKVDGQRILDVGFGGGIGLRRLLDRGAIVVGVDPSASMARYCAERFTTERLNGQLSIEVARVEQLPFDNHTIDQAITVNSIYFWDDPAAGLAELQRVLRPGGVLVVATSAARTCRFFGFGAKGLFVPNPDLLESLALEAGFQRAVIEHRPNLGGTQLTVCTAA